MTTTVLTAERRRKDRGLMDKLSEHAIKMLEIVDNERSFYHDYDREIADIARAVYDIILKVQILKMADRKTEPQTEKG